MTGKKNLSAAAHNSEHKNKAKASVSLQRQFPAATAVALKKELNNNAKTSDSLIKYLASSNNRHFFKINGTNIKVVFSTDKNAPTIESALVKIANKRWK